MIPMIPVRQKFPPSPRLDVRAEVRRRFRPEVAPGASVAVGVGSRGITRLAETVAEVVAVLREAGARPFLIPAMGSHGGATPEGQAQVLADYGVTEGSTGAPVRPSMETEAVARTEDGVDVHVSVEALRADGVVLVNRIKPHTDFGPPLGSGILKMLAIGLGKQRGASACHQAIGLLGHERVIRTVARAVLGRVRLVAGVAVLEDARHAVARIEVAGPGDLEAREEALQAEALRMMPALPFDEADLLIVDRFGKDVSGAGMDPNVTGRTVHGYTSRLSAMQGRPLLRRLYVRELTPASHGNAVGIGMADAVAARVVRSIDARATRMNAWTALSINSFKIPPSFETDREAVEALLATVPRPDGRPPRVQRIRDTLSLETAEVSGAYADALAARPDLEALGPPCAMKFEPDGSLSALCS